MKLRSYIIYRNWKTTVGWYTMITRNKIEIITVLKIDATKGLEFYLARSFLYQQAATFPLLRAEMAGLLNY